MEIHKKIIKKYKILVCVFCFALSITVEAQQEPNFTMYNFNMNIINPAYVSVIDHSELSLAYRSQWTGVPDAPKTSVLSYVSPINDRLGFGISVLNDKIFILNRTDVSLDLAYEVRIEKDYYIHFGLKGTASYIDLRLSEAGAPDIDSKFSGNRYDISTALGAGIYLSHPKYYLSLSTPNASRVERYSLDVNSSDIVVNYLNVYFGGGYVFDVNRNVSITPAIMSRFLSGATATYDFSTTADYMGKIKGGLNYRWKESFSVYSVFSLKRNFKFGFTYNINASDIAKVNTDGSLEFLLKYSWD